MMAHRRTLKMVLQSAHQKDFLRRHAWARIVLTALVAFVAGHASRRMTDCTTVKRPPPQPHILQTQASAQTQLETATEPCALNASVAAPWLLFPGDTCSPRSNVTDFTILVAQRSGRKGHWQKAISIVFYSEGLEELLQNCIYSMVNFGGVDNYVVGTWNDKDLAVCQDLNLPCGDVSSFLPRQLFAKSAAAVDEIGLKRAKKRDQATIIWARQMVVLQLLQLGYAVHVTDVDTAYAQKNVWETYLGYIEAAGADASFHWNYIGWDGPINAGSYVVIPTAKAIKLWAFWVRSFWLLKDKRDYVLDQEGLTKLFQKGVFKVCEAFEECTAAYASNTPLVRAHRVPWYPKPTTENAYEQTEAMCALNPFFLRPDGRPRSPVPQVDACHPSLLYVHVLCQLDRFDRDERTQSKILCLKLAKFWFFVEDEHGRCPPDEKRIRRCKPRDESSLPTCTTRVGFVGNV